MKLLNIFKNHKILTILGLLLIAFALILFAGLLFLHSNTKQSTINLRFFEVQSIDTMKYSRDLSLEHRNDPLADATIAKQVKDIADTGATHVAIGTPYDEEFFPILEKWVNEARKNNLKVWFRGNFAGWEEWFSYKKITREEHLKKTEEFILNHPQIFEDGDIFTACPECENGGPGDPRLINDTQGHRKFLIDEYNVTKNAFLKIGKNVKSNYNSMNKDVADLVMDRPTTEALDGIIVIDHYVKSNEKLFADINALSQKTGGKIVLGEIGAPIPDIHGEMSEQEQINYLEETAYYLSQSKDLIGMNYWVNIGGSTQIWDEFGNKKLAQSAIQNLYKPKNVNIKIVNALGEGINGATVIYGQRYAISNEKGDIAFPYINENQYITINALEYKPKEVKIKDLLVSGEFNLEKEHENIFFKLEKLFSNLFFLENK